MEITDRAAVIMARMGFPETETGPFVVQLRAHVIRQCEQGMVNRSGGTWAPGAEKLTPEERAKAILAMEWALSQGHCHRIKNFDRRIRNLVELRAWIGDRFRAGACSVRVFWSQNILRRRNPFAERTRP